MCLYLTGGQAGGVQASPHQGIGRGQAPSLRPRASHANDPEACLGTDPRRDTHGHSIAALVEVVSSVVFFETDGPQRRACGP